MEGRRTSPELITPPHSEQPHLQTFENKEPKRRSLTDKLTDVIINNKNEMWFMTWNMSLFMWEILRDAEHIVPGDLGGIEGVSVGKPIATEGVEGFVDQHIGNTVETLELFYLSRIPVALVSRVVEMTTDKKVDPRVKLGASLLLSNIIVAGLELSGVGNVSDPYDLIGISAATIWASVGYEVIDYLFKPRETPLSEQWFTKISQLANSMEGIDKKMIAKLNAWMGIPNVPTPSDIAIEPTQYPDDLPPDTPAV